MCSEGGPQAFPRPRVSHTTSDATAPAGVHPGCVGRRRSRVGVASAQGCPDSCPGASAPRPVPRCPFLHIARCVCLFPSLLRAALITPPARETQPFLCSAASFVVLLLLLPRSFPARGFQGSLLSPRARLSFLLCVCSSWPAARLPESSASSAFTRSCAHSRPPLAAVSLIAVSVSLDFSHPRASEVLQSFFSV